MTTTVPTALDPAHIGGGTRHWHPFTPYSDDVELKIFTVDLTRNETVVLLRAKAGAQLGVHDHYGRELSPVARRLSPSAGSPAALASLTPRQREVAALIGEGCSNAAIARRTGLALDSVKKYASQVLAGTGCTNRTELALLVAGGR
jgi:DNA-binding NarL/FixJ family response regulator